MTSDKSAARASLGSGHSRCYADKQRPARKYVQVIVLFVAMAVSGCNASQPTAESHLAVEEEVGSRFRSLIDAAESLDADFYFSHFDEQSFTALNENGTVTHDFEPFQRDYLAGVETIGAYRRLVFKNVKTSVIDSDNAILVNEYDATIELKDGSVVDFSGAGTQVWHRFGDDWLLVSVSSSAKRR